MAQTATQPALTYLNDAGPLPPLAQAFVSVAARLTHWSELRRTRLHLDDLDDYLLKDIGLDRHAANREARRLFWQY